MKNKYTLRIISGTLKGKGIASPPDASVRPTSGRVKESLFNKIRSSLYGARFLDLFAGSGQIGLEAISLGASCVFADISPALVKSNLLLLGCENAIVMQGSFAEVLRQLQAKGQTFDFIFADPPYQAGYYEEIIALSAPLLKKDGLLIVEHAADYTPDIHPLYMEDRRVYGSRCLTFLKGEQK